MRAFFPQDYLPHASYVPITRAASSPNEVAFFMAPPAKAKFQLSNKLLVPGLLIDAFSKKMI